MARSAASALVGMAAAASASAAADTTAILPNFSIMLLPLIICLPNETSNKARAGISRPPSRDISRYGKSENRWVTWKHFWFGSWPCQNTQPESFALVWRSSNGFRFARITRHIQSWSRLRFRAKAQKRKSPCPIEDTEAGVIFLIVSCLGGSALILKIKGSFGQPEVH
jgi:hypothetical protein